MARPFKQQRTPNQASIANQPSSLAADGTIDAGNTQRLHKLLAAAGLGSRRDMESLIESGRVTVNGKIATVGASVGEFDTVRVDSRPVHLQFAPELPQVLMYHKPEGEIVSQDDPEKRATVFDKLPKVKNAKWVAIGRLDINTSGLLMFTTSGELANRFMHPRYEVEREYSVRILGELTEDQMLQLTQGLELEDGPANFDRISAQGGEGANHWYNVVLREGRNREVRRLFEALHFAVSRLIRVRFGPIALPPRVKRGMMLAMDPKDVEKLLEWAEMPVPKTPHKQLSQRQKVKASATFTPKAKPNRARKSVLERTPEQQAEMAKPAGFKARNSKTGSRTSRPSDKSTTSKPPRKNANRRVRQSSDVKEK